jgi:hypothetical protein
MIGRVVWAHESGPHIGEFGIRFTHLSNDDQTRIEALIQRWGRTTAKAPVVRLLLDGVDSSIVAEVHSESETELSVEQPLPFLAIGSAVVNESTSRRGHLEAVELKMDEATPKLVLSIGYEVEGAAEASAEEGGSRDTLPDEAPSTRMHDTPRIVRYDPGVETPSETASERLRAYAKSATDQLASSVGTARSAVTEGFLPRVTTNVKELFALIARFIGALRSQLDEKPRRKQVPRSEAARAHMKNTRRNGRRYLLVAAMACGIVAAGWGIYLWAASGAEAGTATGAETETETGAGAETATATGAAAETETETAAAAAAAAATGSETAEGSGTEAASVSAAGAGAYEVQGAPLPPETVRGTAFGADSVAGGEKYVLRMSNPVAEMDGIIEQDGFSVTIPGSLSLSRAGPIATAHPDVEHASILNRGDFSELTIRFVTGRQPAYRVEARGPAVEITIAR